MRKYNELEVAEEFAKAVRLFEIMAAHKPQLRTGLSAAVALSKLWCQKYEPGNPAHPFPNFNMALSEIPDNAEANRIRLERPEPVEDKSEKSRRPRTPSPVDPEILSGENAEVYSTILMQIKEFGYAMLRKNISNNITEGQIKGMMYRLHHQGVIKRVRDGVYEVVK